MVPPKISCKSSPWLTKLRTSICSGRSSGRVQGVRNPPPPPPPPIRPNPCLRLKFLHRQNRVSLFNWLIFLMKRALHFATKLNSRDIQKCNCFWVPSYDLFTSARKAVFPAPTAIGVHRLRNTWLSLWEVICHKRFNSPFWTKVWIPPPRRKIPGSAPELGSVEAFNWKWEKVLTFNCYNARKALEYVIVKRACFRSLSGHAPLNEEICMKR